jgi:Leucine-rich repeat (LRR) protein
VPGAKSSEAPPPSREKIPQPTAQVSPPVVEIEPAVEIDDDPRPQPALPPEDRRTRGDVLAEAVAADTTKPESRRLRKRKRDGQAEALAGPGEAPAAAVLLGLGIVMLACQMMWPGDFRLPGPASIVDYEAVIASLSARGVILERDQNAPAKPVIVVRMVGPGFTNEDVAKLKALPSIERLYLSHSGINNLALDEIASLKKLKVLDLSSTNTSDGGMPFIKDLVNLEELQLNNTRVTDNGLLNLTGMTRLKILGLKGCIATGARLRELLPGLKVER